MTRRITLLLALAIAVLGAASCSGVERAKPKSQTRRLSEPVFTLEVEPMMRNTVASESIVVGTAETVVRGYGLVVGLDNTGSRVLPATVRAYMLQMMTKMGVGSHARDAGNLSPRAMLDSEETAVVIVEGIIPPAAPAGTRFDVRVYAVPGSGTTSLEGGSLWTTELRPGPLAVGGRQAFSLAKAKGMIFINPFMTTDQDETAPTTVDMTTGRILDGGVVSKSMPVKLRLATPSHTRTATLITAINTNFPREPGQRDETARGESGESIEITIPPSHHDDSGEFIELLRHTTLNVAAPEQMAMNVRRSLLSTPGASESASWRWQALGRRAIPMFQDLYDYPEEQPRLAALEAGCRLGDPMVVDPLVDMANNSKDLDTRLACLALLGQTVPNPRIDMEIRPMLDDENVDIRLGAFESLLERQDPYIKSVMIDEKFTLHLVRSEKPLIYISQSGKPQIVMFGTQIPVKQPMTLMTQENNLILKADEGDEHIEIFYRQRSSESASIEEVDPYLAPLVFFLGHRTSVESPATGIDLSYSETIGTLHELWKAGYIQADFKAEQDRILAAILRSTESEELELRPEFDGQPLAPSLDDALPGLEPGDDSVQGSRKPKSGQENGRNSGTVVPR